MNLFETLTLHPLTQRAIENMNISTPTEIQSKAIPEFLAGKDIIGQSHTGSGKTLAFGIPVIERLSKNQRQTQAIILTPTRELAMQINEVIGKLAAGRRITTALLVGGRAYKPQFSALRYGAQIVIGTPGRINDHLEQGTLKLEQIRMCVLDEADQMLDAGFAPVIEKMLEKMPSSRQIALFSATMPGWVKTLTDKHLKDPSIISVTRASDADSGINQIAYQVPGNLRLEALKALLSDESEGIVLVFGRTKAGIEKLGNILAKDGYDIGTLHGNLSQRARERVLADFRFGRIRMLLATNVAARGLDIQNIAKVINYELPETPELFTHRIGRTGRMGKSGQAITLVTPADLSKWRKMTRALGHNISISPFNFNNQSYSKDISTKIEVNETLSQGTRADSNIAKRKPAKAFTRFKGNQRSNASFNRAPKGNRSHPEQVNSIVTTSNQKQRRSEPSLNILIEENRTSSKPFKNITETIQRERDQRYSRTSGGKNHFRGKRRSNSRFTENRANTARFQA